MQDKLLKREEVAEELTWRLEDIYESDAKWEEDLKKSDSIGEKLASYVGKLSESAAKLLEFFKLYEESELL